MPSQSSTYDANDRLTSDNYDNLRFLPSVRGRVPNPKITSAEIISGVGTGLGRTAAHELQVADATINSVFKAGKATQGVGL